MARKKRGGKAAAANRKTKASLKHFDNVVAEDNTQSPAESEESCSSGTPKSCNTPVDIEKPLAQNPAALVQHKKFGKFRCLLEDTSSRESEAQAEPMELVTKDVETVTVDTDSIVEELKAVEIADESDQIEIVPVITEEIVEIAESVLENPDVEVELKSEVISTEVVDIGVCLVSDESQEQCVVLTPVQEISEIFEEKPQEVDTKKPKTDVETKVRRSSRIKSISVLKQRSKGHGLVKSDKAEKKEMKPLKLEVETGSENSNSSTINDKNSADSPSFLTPTLASDDLKPVKVKSRWRRSSELEMGSSSPIIFSSQLVTSPQLTPDAECQPSLQVPIHKEESPVYDEEMENRLRQFQTLQENQYLTERTTCKEAKKMVCDCFLTKEETERGEFGCGEDCLNRLLMIECGNQCVVGDRCTNKRFQKLQYASCEVFRTEKKGFGIKATADIGFGEFILEYVGEVLDPYEFEKRAKEYSKEKNRHYYFMALRADAVIDATQKGNISRFINHSCDPNAETQKWTVNGELRIGFFSTRHILAGEEITFDYQFQRYGKEAQKCHCESANCRGWIGEEPDDEDDEDEDEESEREENEEDEIKESDVKEPKAVVKSSYKKRAFNKNQRKDLFEDLDLDEEIGLLTTTGVKNQAHTLKLSRLMVRAKDEGPRMQLLKLLHESVLPCRRLFLDYHGLRLIHGWMCDADNIEESDNKNYPIRIAILKTLLELPISNKSMLEDSKVANIVERWSLSQKLESLESPDESSNNSPLIDAQSNEPFKKEDVETASPQPEELKQVPSEEELKVETSPKCDETIKLEEFVKLEESIKLETPYITEEHEIKVEEPMEVVTEKESENELGQIVEQEPDKIKTETAELEQLEEKENNIENILLQETKENGAFLLKLTANLLAKWTTLKEEFRIPKKERIEQMKEHEREADRDYKEISKENLISRKQARYSWKSARYRIAPIDKLSKESNSSKTCRIDDRNMPVSKLSKYQRRQLFAMQVAQEEKDRRRKHEQEMWRIHEQRCMMMGVDPRMTNMELTSDYHWNNNAMQWQNFGPGGSGIPSGGAGMLSGASGMPPGVPGIPPNGPGMPPVGPVMHPGGPRMHLGGPGMLPGCPGMPPGGPGMPPVGPGMPPGGLGMPPGGPGMPLGGSGMPPGGPGMPAGGVGMPLGGPGIPPGGPGIPLGGTGIHPGTPGMSPGGTVIAHCGQNMYSGGTPIPPRGPGLPQGGPGMPPRGPGMLPGGLGIPPRGPGGPRMLHNGSRMQHTGLGMQLGGSGMPHGGLGLPHGGIGVHPGGPNILPGPGMHPEIPLGNPGMQLGHMPPNSQGMPPPPGVHLQHSGSGMLPGGMAPPMYEVNSLQQPQISTNASTSSLPPQPFSCVGKEEVLFAGPIPPPVSLPLKWKCAKDKYGRPYYYHIKVRISQWEPPLISSVCETPVELPEETSSSSDTSSLSSDTSTDSEDDSELNDSKLLREIRNKLKHTEKRPEVTVTPVMVPVPELKLESPQLEKVKDASKSETLSKRKRDGLVQEIIISPRREEDKLAHRAQMKKYKETKYKLRQKAMEQTKKKLKNKLVKGSSSLKAKKHKSSKSIKQKIINATDLNSDEAKKIKEVFRSSMASVMVQYLNAYRKPDCKNGRITNTEDFKHLARKLTHFVMLKELKHCQNIQDLSCNDSVKSKARDFVRKYMSKFGETYTRPKDEVD